MPEPKLACNPGSDWQALASKALARWTACLCSVPIILLGTLLFFGVRLQSVAGLVSSLAALTVRFTGIVTAISTLGASEQSVACAGWSTLLVLGMVGGIMVPRVIMPAWLASVGKLSPVRWGRLALEHTLWRGRELRDGFLPCALLVGVGSLSLCGGPWVLRRSAA